MTGDAPQPGETPRKDREPWSFTDPNTAWWRVEQERDQAEALADAVAARPRHPRRRPTSTTPADAPVPPAAFGGPEPAFAPEALDAHAAGAQDVRDAIEAPPAALVEAEQEATIERVEAEAAAEAVADAVALAGPEVERDHKGTTERFNPTEEYAMDTADKSGELAHRPEGVPEVMILPEHTHDRPTVALDRETVLLDRTSGADDRTGNTATDADDVARPAGAAVPEQPPASRSRLSEASRERLENSRERMEASPFWLPEEERAAAGAARPAPEMRQRLATAPGPTDVRRGRPPAKKPRSPRGPLPGLLGLVALALVAAFFSWVSAEPFWLAVGHGDRGMATVSRCSGSGVTQRCAGAFAAADGSFTVERVTLLGVAANARSAGAVTPARMVSPDSRQAYVGDAGLLLHLRWVLGFILIVLCGYGIAGLTGARQLETTSARRNAVLISLAGPVLLLIGFLAATY